MARKARKAKSSAAATWTKIGHLLVRFDGQYYFIPADKIGPPLDPGEVFDELGVEVDGLIIEKGTLVDLEFAMQISEGDAATGMVIRKRN